MISQGQPFSVVVDGTTVTARGELDLASADLLVDACPHEVERLDMRAVTFVDSSGIRAIMRASKLVVRRGGQLVLVSPSAEVRRVLAMLGLTEHLPIVEA